MIVVTLWCGSCGREFELEVPQEHKWVLCQSCGAYGPFLFMGVMKRVGQKVTWRVKLNEP